MSNHSRLKQDILEEMELCPVCRTELEHITINKEDVFGCLKCKKEIKRIDSIKAKECQVLNKFCEFALENGNCSQPTLSLELKCFDKFSEPTKRYIRKNTKIITTIKRHLKGIEKAVEKLEKE